METIFYALLAGYIVMLVFLLIFIDLTIPGNCVKCFFWPIYGPIYSIGIIFGIFVYLTRNEYKLLTEILESYIATFEAGMIDGIFDTKSDKVYKLIDKIKN